MPDPSTRFQVIKDGGQTVIIDSVLGQPVDMYNKPVGAYTQDSSDAPDTETQEEGGLSWFDTIFKEVPKATVYGVGQAMAGMLSFVPDVLGVTQTDIWMNEDFTIGESITSQGELMAKSVDDQMGLETTTGRVLGEIVKYGVGYTLGGGPVRGLIKKGAMRAFGRSTVEGFAKRPILKASVQGMMGDLIVSTKRDDPFINKTIAELGIPILSDGFNYVTNDEDTTAAQARMNAMVDGILPGIGFDSLGKALKSIFTKARKARGGNKKAQEELAEELSKLDPEELKQLDEKSTIQAVQEGMKDLPEYQQVAARIDEVGDEILEGKGVDLMLGPNGQITTRNVDIPETTYKTDTTTKADTPTKAPVEGAPVRKTKAEVQEETFAPLREEPKLNEAESSLAKYMEPAQENIFKENKLNKHIWANMEALKGVKDEATLHHMLAHMTDSVLTNRQAWGIPDKLPRKQIIAEFNKVIGSEFGADATASAIKMARTMAKTQEEQVLQMYITKQAVAQGRADLHRLSGEVMSGGDSRAMLEWHRSFVRQEDLESVFSGMRSAAGRMLNILRRTKHDPDGLATMKAGHTPVGPESKAAIATTTPVAKLTDAEVKAELTVYGGEKRVYDAIQKFRNRLLGGATGKEARDASGAILTGKISNVFTYYINNILGFQSQLRNAWGNLLSTVIDPVLVGTGRAITGDIKGAKEAFRRYTGLMMGLNDALAAGKRNWGTGSKTYGAEAVKLFGVSPAELGVVKRLLMMPLRALGTTDEFFQVLNGRAFMWEKLSDGYFDRALKSGKDQANKWVDAEMKAWSIDPERFRVGSDKYGATRTASVLSFTERIDIPVLGRIESLFSPTGKAHEGALAGKNVLSASLMRFFVPFISTPIRIVAQGTQYVPILPALHGNVRNAFMGGMYKTPDDAARFWGRQLVGTAFVGSAYAMYASGRLTGNGPAPGSPEYTAWRRAHQPRSIKIGNTWVSYDTAEPMSLVIGLAADTFDKMQDYSQNGDLDALGFNLMQAVARNTVDKTFTKSLSDVMDFLQDPEGWRAKKLGGNVVRGMVPWSGTIGNATRFLDDTVYKSKDFVDNFKGLSLGFWPKDYVVYNLDGSRAEMGWDASLSPFSLGGGGGLEDLVTHEVASYRGSVNIVPPRSLGGIDLKSKQESDYFQYVTNEKIGGKTLHETLKAYITSPTYKNNYVDPTTLSDDLLAKSGMYNIRHLNKIVKRFKKVAERKLISENPELQAAAVARNQSIRALKRGDTEKAASFIEQALELNQ